MYTTYYIHVHNILYTCTQHTIYMYMFKVVAVNAERTCIIIVIAQHRFNPDVKVGRYMRMIMEDIVVRAGSPMHLDCYVDGLGPRTTRINVEW